MYEVLYKCTPGELSGFLLLFYLLQGDRKGRNEYSCKYVCVCTYVCIYIYGYYNIYVLNAWKLLSAHLLLLYVDD